METPSGDKPALDAQADAVSAFAQGRGLDVKRIPFPRAGDYLYCAKPGTDMDASPEVLLLAHMDTVHPKGAFGTEILTETDGHIRAPGIIDCKGGAAVALLTLETLIAMNCGRRAGVLLTTDEEVSGRLSAPDGTALITRYARGALAALNCETGKPGVLTVGRKGILRLRVSISGKAAHAGNAYFDGASAIREAAAQILAIEALSSPQGNTFNCGTIAGGSSANTVPAACTFEVDVRSSSPEELDAAGKKVRDLLSVCHVPGTVCSCETLSCRPPMERRPENDRLLQTLNRVGAAHGFPHYEAAVRGGGSDAAYTVLAGVPTVCSLGMVGTGEHTVQECGETDSLLRRATFLTYGVLAL